MSYENNVFKSLVLLLPDLTCPTRAIPVFVFKFDLRKSIICNAMKTL